MGELGPLGVVNWVRELPPRVVAVTTLGALAYARFVSASFRNRFIACTF
jgi:hypothetical protein